jgi:Tol biopolymer transport system component
MVAACMGALSAVTIAVSCIQAQSSEMPASSTLPLTPTRTVEFDTDEGTWLSVDVSPDGSRLVFDLLGDLYTLEIAGGDAQRLTDGLPFDSQPVWSPDNRRIAFLSDRSGAENVWVMNVDGTDARRITDNVTAYEYVSPAWAPDGQSIYVSQYRADHNAIRLARCALDTRRCEELTPRGANSIGAAPSPDGRYVYYAMRRGPVFEDDVHLPLYAIERRALDTGRTETIVTNIGSAMRPRLSPDGAWLAYAVRQDGQTALRVRNLANGIDRVVAFPIQRDVQEGLPTRDLLPGYAFTPDGRDLVLTRNGRFERDALADGSTRAIPFKAHVHLALGPLLRQHLAIDTGAVRARLIDEPRASPDGKRLAFSTLGRIHTVDLKAGAKPARLTHDGPPEFQPSWSADGHSIAYVTWTLQGAGAIWIADVHGGRARRVTHDDAWFYSDVTFVPGGKTLMALRSSAQERLETLQEPMWTGRTGGFLRQAELVELPLAGGPARVIASGPMDGAAQFTAETDRVYVHTSDGLEAIARDGSWRQLVFRLVGPGYYFSDEPAAASDIKISPDGRHALVLFNQQLYLVATDAEQAPPGRRGGGRGDDARGDPASHEASPAQGVEPRLDPSSDHPNEQRTLPPPERHGSPGGRDHGRGGPPPPPIDLNRPDAPAIRLTTVGADFSSWSADGNSLAWGLGSTFHRMPLAAALQSASLPAHDRARQRSVEHYPFTVEVPRDTPLGDWVLTGATLITMRGEEVLTDADVVVHDNRIAAIGPQGRVAIPSGAKSVDGRGQYVIPGLIDAHMHVGGIRRSLLQFDDWGLRATLAYGVTSILDPSSLSIDMFDYEDLIDSGRVVGPRLFTTGTAMFSYNRLQSLDDARDLLERYRVDYRTRNVKQYRIGPRRDREWIAMAAQEQGVMPTCEGAIDMKMGLTQVLDGFSGNEHAFGTFPLYRDVVELMARSGTHTVQTLLISHGGPPGGADFVARERAYDDATIAKWYPSAVRERLFARVPWVAPRDYVYGPMASGAAAIQRGGGVVGMGSHGNYPGVGLHWEMYAHAAGGMTPHEVLRAATLGSATAIGRQDELGSLEPGKYADFVVLDANPLDDLHNARRIRYVVKDGRVYDEAALRR